MTAVLGVLTAAMLAAGMAPQQTSTTTSHVSPFACDRMALDPAARHRHFDELGPMLRSMRKAVRELPDGYEFEFPSDSKTYALINEWAQGERLCCPFFDIAVRAEREGGAIWLRLTGREGTKPFIHSDFPTVWFQK
jgi:hypothetical protein